MNDIGRISDRDYRRMRRPRLWWLPFTSVILLAFVSGVAVKGKNSKAITLEEALTTLAGNPPEEWEQMQNLGAVYRSVEVGASALQDWARHDGAAGESTAIYLGYHAKALVEIVRRSADDPTNPFRDEYLEFLESIRKEIR